MKKSFGNIAAFVCCVVGVLLLYMTFYYYNALDSKDVESIVNILPTCIGGILFFIAGNSLAKNKKEKLVDNGNPGNTGNSNNNAVVLIVFGIIFAVIGGVLNYNEVPNKVDNGTVLYNFAYYDMLIPGSKSDITIFADKINIITTHYCSAVDCEPNVTEETVNYSKDNIDKLLIFLKNNFSTIDTEIYANGLTEQQREVIEGIKLGEYYLEIAVENYKYKVDYTQSDSLGYIIYFKDSGSILVKKLTINSEYEIVNVDTYSLDFSKENLSILNAYIDAETKREYADVIYKSNTLRKDEQHIFKSIIENDESYLNGGVKLSYTISYDGINCSTPSLYLYSDNTYEYYDTYGVNDDAVVPKTGTYNYDVSKIISNISKYEKNDIGPYYVRDNAGNNYVTYNTNIELQELLSSLGVTLEKCLEYQ